MINTGIFPNALKTAKVILLFKRDENYIFNHYRPISLLQSISKTINNNILYQIYQYFQENSLHSDNQYGFRTDHSTELTSVALVESKIKDLDNNLLPISKFLNLSIAFDTIDHNILVSKLSYCNEPALVRFCGLGKVLVVRHISMSSRC